MVTNSSPSDNEDRASRLQQLVDSMASIQTDVEKLGQQMEEKNVKYRPAIDKLLKASGMGGVDDVINKAASLIAPQERGEFEAVSSHSFQPEIWDADTLSSIIAH